MSLSPWARLVSNSNLTGTIADRIRELGLENIETSKDKTVWDFNFSNRFKVTEEDEAAVYTLLRETFGEKLTYNLHFQEVEEKPDTLELLKETLSGEREITTDVSMEETDALMNEARIEKQSKAKVVDKGPKVYYGKLITSSPGHLIDATEENKNFTLSGQVFKINEVREMKAGTTLFDFNIKDDQSSIRVKLFVDVEKYRNFDMNWLSEGKSYIMNGVVKYDKFCGELVFNPYNINEAKNIYMRKDTSPEKRVELHLHTKMSAMDGCSYVKDLINTAYDWGHEAMAITDHGVVQSFPDAMKAIDKLRGKAGMKKDEYPIKIIYGVEGYLIDGDGSSYMENVRKPKVKARNAEALSAGEVLEKDERTGSWHIIILAKNLTGVKNLYTLISLSHLDFFYKKPRIPREAIEKYREGLIIGSACEAGELFQAVLNDKPYEEIKKIASFYDYLEIQPIMNNGYLLRNGRVANEDGLRELNRRIYDLGHDIGKPVAATGDVHFLNPEDEVFRRILQAGQGYKDCDYQPPLYFRTTDEMLEEFSYLGEEGAHEVVIDTPKMVADMCEALTPIPDGLHTPEIPGAEEQIEQMARAKAHELYGEVLPDIIQARLDRELKSILGAGYTVLYLIAQKLVKYSNDHGYMVGSRGSVGSSFVAFLSDITEVNPLVPHYVCKTCKHVEFGDEKLYDCGVDMPDRLCPHCGKPMYKDGFNIPFEVFLGFNGDKVPDIDLNFSGDFQSTAQKYTEELFGAHNVFKAGTISALQDRTAYGFVKKYYEEKGIPIRDSEADRLVSGMVDIKRTTGQHPGGIVVLPKGDCIENYTPVQRPADDPNSIFVTTHFDYHAIDNCLVKLDMLGHDNPTIIKMLEDLTGIDVHNIPLDDKEVVKLFRCPDPLGFTEAESGINTGTIGIPEFGTTNARAMLSDIQPNCFMDLVRMSGFSHGTDVWHGNARDLLVEKIADVKSLISCRDDIMIGLIAKGVNPSHSFKIMEAVRKGKGLTPENIEEMEEHDVPDWYIGSCRKIKYLFPRAHAVAYVTDAFRIAWFKIHYPKEYYATLYSIRDINMDATLCTKGLKALEDTMKIMEQKRIEKTSAPSDGKTYIFYESCREMLLRGYKFYPIDLYKSDAKYYKVEEDGIRLPFTAFAGLGETAAESVVGARNERPFRSKIDLKNRTKLSKSLIDGLTAIGAFGDLPDSDQQTLF